MDPTARFSNRVDNYRRYRPGYPAAVIDLIRTSAGLGDGARVADIGSGTGIFSKLLLDAGWEVFAIEPNAPMRRAAEEELGSHRNFRSVDGRAEATGLPAGALDAITCAQAFHWFDVEAARAEFARILKPGGWAFLIWNERQLSGPADRAYSQILESIGLAYQGVRERSSIQNDRALKPFFRDGTYCTVQIPNPSRMNWETLRGRFLSSSYVPPESDQRHAPLLAQLDMFFRGHQQNGEIILDQSATVYFGQL